MASGSPLDLTIRRNTVILSATMAVNSAVLQLTAAVSSLTFVLVTGVRGLLGLGPAIFLTSSGLTAVPAGRLMDRLGRMPVITAGFALGAGGCALTALATRTESTVTVSMRSEKRLSFGWSSNAMLAAVARAPSRVSGPSRSVVGW